MMRHLAGVAIGDCCRLLSSVVASEFSEELHVAICTPEKGLDELGRSCLSNSKSIFYNGGNYNPPES